MSLLRLVYFSAIIGGWAAFLGWMVSEANHLERGGPASVAVTGALVGAAIGIGLNVLSGMANAQWKQQLKRVVSGLIAGGLGGAVGAGIGNVLFMIGAPRALGWMIMGMGIGVGEGLFERSASKLRNGLIGGAIGGLLGGILFDPIQAAIHSNTGMSSRASAFVILGMCIGVLIGLVQVVLKEAWLTVLDGYRPGRQLILSAGATVLGKAEYAALPFVGKGDNDLDWEHARIIGQAGGKFAVEDNNSKLGVMLNGSRIQGRALLNDGDVLKIGSNIIRFSERHRKGTSASPVAAATAPAPPVATPRTVAPPVLSPMTPSAPPPTPYREPPRPPAAPAATPPPTPYREPPRPPVAPAAAPPPMPYREPPRPPVAPAAAPPKPAPPSSPRPAPQPQPAEAAGAICPGCRRAVPKGQRYCILCDINF